MHFTTSSRIFFMHAFERPDSSVAFPSFAESAAMPTASLMFSAVWPCSLFHFGMRVVFWFGVDPLDVVRYGLHGLFVRGRGISLDRKDR